MRHLPRSIGQVAYYRCVNGCVGAPMEWLDTMATVGVVGFCARSPMYEILTRTGDKEAQAAKDEEQAERDRMAGFEAQAISGTISAESYARIARGIEARITELEARARELAVPPALRDLASAAATQEERWEDIYARWLAMPVSARRAVLAGIFAPTLDPVGDGAPDDRNRFRMPARPELMRKP
jgi:hypothetical protein